MLFIMPAYLTEAYVLPIDEYTATHYTMLYKKIKDAQTIHSTNFQSYV